MKISQREARALKKRVDELEGMERGRRDRWCRSYPGGTHLGTLTGTRNWLDGRIEAARMLGHAVVVTTEDTGAIHYYALPLAGEPK